MKDVFVDNNVAKNLCNPVTDPFKEFIKWLFVEGAIVLNKKLEVEYIRGNQTLSTIIDRLTRDGRVNNITKEQLVKLNFSKIEEKKFLSNKDDRVHLKTVFLSTRKIALSYDVNFIKDINGYKKIDGIQPICTDCPSKINYQ